MNPVLRKMGRKIYYLAILGFAVLFAVLVMLMGNVFESPATYALIILNIIVFGLVKAKKVFVSEISTSYVNTLRGKEYYRIVTAAFTHEAGWHILMNMISLYNLGVGIEPFLGTRLYIMGYVSIMLVGGVFSSTVHKKFSPQVNSIGASGVIYGIFGIYLVLVLALYGMEGITFFIKPLIFLVLMMFSKQIDNIGHVTGLLTGILFGLLLISGVIS